MPQAFPLDRLRQFLYNALAFGSVALLAGSCGPRLRSIAPSGLTPLPAEQANAWAAALRPDRHVRYDLRWRYTTQQGSSAGRAAVRIAPPDTLRFDYRGPFGKAGSALIVGNDVIWTQPEEETASLVPTAPLFWAALGSPLAPPDDAQTLGREWDQQRAWRYVRGGDVMDFIVRESAPRQVLAELRRDDRIIGATRASLRPGTLHPAEARIAFPGEAAVFTFTVEAVDTLAAFGPQTWQR